jgi:hypothetical protein
MSINADLTTNLIVNRNQNIDSLEGAAPQRNQIIVNREIAKYQDIGTGIDHFQNEANFQNKMTFFSTPPTSRNYSTQGSWVRCNNISSYFINGRGMHFLTSPMNIPGKVYYLLRTNSNGFKPLTQNRNSILNAQLQTSRINEFIAEISRELINDREFYSIHSSQFMYSILYFIGAIILATITIGIIAGWILLLALVDTSPTTTSYTYSTRFIVGVIAAVPAIGSAYLFWLFSKRKYFREIAVCTHLLTRGVSFSAILNRWNNNYFLDKGMYVKAPANLAYIEMVLDKTLLLNLVPHLFPYDLETVSNNISRAKNKIFTWEYFNDKCDQFHFPETANLMYRRQEIILNAS